MDYISRIEGKLQRWITTVTNNHCRMHWNIKWWKCVQRKIVTVNGTLSKLMPWKLDRLWRFYPTLAKMCDWSLKASQYRAFIQYSSIKCPSSLCPNHTASPIAYIWILKWRMSIIMHNVLLAMLFCCIH